MLKKTIVFALLSALMLCLVACGGDETTSDASKADSSAESISNAESKDESEITSEEDSDASSDASSDTSVDSDASIDPDTSDDSSSDVSDTSSDSSEVSDEEPDTLTSVIGKWYYEDDYIDLVRSSFAYDSTLAGIVKKMTDDEFIVNVLLSFTETEMTLEIKLDDDEVAEFANEFYTLLYQASIPNGEMSYEDFLAQHGGLESAITNLEFDRYTGKMSIDCTLDGDKVYVGADGDYMEVEFGTDSFTVTAVYDAEGNSIPASDDNYFTGRTYIWAE